MMNMTSVTMILSTIYMRRISMDITNGILAMLFIYTLFAFYFSMQVHFNNHSLLKFVFYPYILCGRGVWKVFCYMFDIDSNVIDWRVW